MVGLARDANPCTEEVDMRGPFRILVGVVLLGIGAMMHTTTVVAECKSCVWYSGNCVACAATPGVGWRNCEPFCDGSCNVSGPCEPTFHNAPLSPAGLVLIPVDAGSASTGDNAPTALTAWLSASDTRLTANATFRDCAGWVISAEYSESDARTIRSSTRSLVI
jgi:hypothetical protein